MKSSVALVLDGLILLLATMMGFLLPIAKDGFAKPPFLLLEKPPRLGFELTFNVPVPLGLPKPRASCYK